MSPYRTPRLLLALTTGAILIVGTGAWLYRQYLETRKRPNSSRHWQSAQGPSQRRSLRNPPMEQENNNPIVPPPSIPPTVKLPLFFDREDSLRLEICDATMQAVNDSATILHRVKTLDLPQAWQGTIKLRAEITPDDWNGTNFTAFLQQLEAFRINDHHGRCQALSVILPHQADFPDDLESIGVPSTLLIPDHLIHAIFFGHNTQLGRFSVPHQGNFLNLRTLTLLCNVSTLDCVFLLSKGRTSLEEFEVHTIRGDLDINGQVLATGWHHPRDSIAMERLRSLTIFGDCCLNALLCGFTFPALTNMEISNSYRKEAYTLLDWFTTINLQTLNLRLNCPVNAEEEIFLRRWCVTFVVGTDDAVDLTLPNTDNYLV